MYEREFLRLIEWQDLLAFLACALALYVKCLINLMKRCTRCHAAYEWCLMVHFLLHWTWDNNWYSWSKFVFYRFCRWHFLASLISIADSLRVIAWCTYEDHRNLGSWFSGSRSLFWPLEMTCTCFTHAPRHFYSAPSVLQAEFHRGLRFLRLNCDIVFVTT